MWQVAWENWVSWFQEVVEVTLRLYFCQECSVASIEEIPEPTTISLEQLLGISGRIYKKEEKIILLLALMPHLSPQALDIFFAHNKNLDRPYTEFGGWKGLSHGGFLPTGETAAFLAGRGKLDKRTEVMQYFEKEHWFYQENVLRLENGGEGEPFLSGRLRMSEEVLSRIFTGKEYKPDCSAGFPAHRLTTCLEWDDLVLGYRLAQEIEEINTWLQESRIILEDWGLGRYLKPGYRALFYGPPGTGKTLTASLLGKKNRLDVYRIDLSMVVSKYIGETEKNLAQIFDLAEHRSWILFFDEADALFGKRTATATSNDRHANQEVAYLLQRIEDFPGTIILATNLRANIDEAFSRRFQSVLYFPMPDEEQRKELWEKMIPPEWLGENRKELLCQMAVPELSGGSIANVVRRCALQLLMENKKLLTPEILQEAIRKELYKEGKIT